MKATLPVFFPADPDAAVRLAGASASGSRYGDWMYDNKLLKPRTRRG